MSLHAADPRVSHAEGCGSDWPRIRSLLIAHALSCLLFELYLDLDGGQSTRFLFAPVAVSLQIDCFATGVPGMRVAGVHVSSSWPAVTVIICKLACIILLQVIL